MKKLIILTLLSICSFGNSYAQKIITIAKDTKVYEAPQARDEYAAQNSKGEDVILKEGMSFEVREEKAGWYVIEYTNGLRGNVMQNSIAAASSIKTPSAGKYTVTNNPAKTMVLNGAGSEWTLSSDSEKYKGKLLSNVMLFISDDGVPVYSLTILNGKPYLYCLSNMCTNFM